MKVVVLGASTKSDRYSNIATNMLLDYDHEVVAVGNREGRIRSVEIMTGEPAVEDVHTVTLYVGPARQEPLYDYILALKPNRVIFNPGTENNELMERCAQANIEVVVACTLVMLRTSQF